MLQKRDRKSSDLFDVKVVRFCINVNQRVASSYGVGGGGGEEGRKKDREGGEKEGEKGKF